eukprot:s27_g46.t1
MCRCEEECAASVACRTAESCSECIKLGGCGWSPVREKCFPAHPIASDSETCGNTEQRSPEEWVKHAKDLMDVKQPDFGPAKLRAAYRALKIALTESSASDEMKDSIAALLSRITPKLEAVFDDEDAKDLLEASRHHGMASAHREIPRVPRRKFLEAKEMIMRDDPVVITDLFEALDLPAKPVSHKWTLDYLNLRMHQGFYNIAADIPGRCCQYYEPRKVAAEAKYPYPFRPTTHLYRDSFDGFAKTLHSGETEGSRHLVHYLHDVVMERDGSPVVAGQAAPEELAAELRAVAEALRPAQRLQPFFGGIANAKLWIGQKGVVMPLHYDTADNLYVMAWGRKRVLLAEPGQQDAFYPYPSSHPNAGSAQVNVSAPNLTRFPGFASAKLHETVVGPGDVLFLPNHWWHQFEQPFEQTASLNVWSYEAPDAPPVSLRDKRMRGIAIQNFMEAKMVELFKNKAGVVLKALAHPAKRASKKAAQEKQLQKANASLFEAAEAGRRWVDATFGKSGMLESIAQLVERFLELHRYLPRLRGWKPGQEWDMSALAPLEDHLAARCQPAARTATFASVCRTK